MVRGTFETHARLNLRNDKFVPITYDAILSSRADRIVFAVSELRYRNEVLVTLAVVILSARGAAPMGCKSRPNHRATNYSCVSLSVLFVHDDVDYRIYARSDVQQQIPHHVTD